MSVHPRARGEHYISRGFKATEAYSRRFIPALAGNINSGRASHARRLRAVHPRARGEHRQIHAEVVGIRRFIPALAGNIQASPDGLLDRCREAVHPRARGEHFRTHLPRGSASWAVHPRARGEHYTATTLAHGLRTVHPRARGEHPQPDQLHRLTG